MRKSISQVKESSGHWFLFKRQKKRLTCWGLPLISEREIQEVSRFNFLKKISEKDTKEYDYKNLEGIKSLQVTCTYTCCPFSVSHGVKDLVFLSLRMKRCRTSPWYGIVKGFLLAQVNMPNYGMQKKQEKKKGGKLPWEREETFLIHGWPKIQENQWKPVFCGGILSLLFLLLVLKAMWSRLFSLHIYLRKTLLKNVVKRWVQMQGRP